MFELSLQFPFSAVMLLVTHICFVQGHFSAVPNAEHSLLQNITVTLNDDSTKNNTKSVTDK